MKIRYFACLVLIALSVGCKNSNSVNTEDPQFVGVVFTTQGTSDFYKIKSVEGKSVKINPPEKLGPITASGWTRVLNIDAVLTKDCYERFEIKRDLLPICDDNAKSGGTLKKAASTKASTKLRTCK